MKKNMKDGLVETKAECDEEQGVQLLQQSPDDTATEKKIGLRHLQVVNICFLVFSAYYTRNSLSVAIVAMNDRNSTINQDIPTFNWTNKNVIISSFFVGYVPSQIVSTWLFRSIPFKWYGVGSLGLSTVFGLLTPSMAIWFGDRGVIAARILQGIGQGFTFPAVHHFLGRWVPPNERAGMGGMVHASRPVATLISMCFTGYIAGSYLGWPWIFYISNAVSLMWCVSFAIFSFENPARHPRISIKERKYIERCLGSENSEKELRIPYKAMAKSVPFWALFLTQTGYSWGFWTQQTQMPMYLKYVLKFDISLSGSLSALPFLAQWILSYIFSFISDYLLHKQFWSLTTARKTMNSIGMFVPAAIFIMLQYTGPDQPTRAVVLLVLGNAINAATFCGFMINHSDLSPRFAGAITGLSNGPSQITGILAPLFVQAVVKNETDPEEWKYVFSTSAGIYIASGLIFQFFGTAEVQPWNNENSEECTDGKEEEG